jgi:hypothetical protein
MNTDWYGDSLNGPASTTPRVVGYGVWATSREMAPYLCKDLGRLWPTAAAARQWLDTLRPVPGGHWTYQVVELREVVR